MANAGACEPYSEARCPRLLIGPCQNLVLNTPSLVLDSGQFPNLGELERNMPNCAATSD